MIKILVNQQECMHTKDSEMSYDDIVDIAAGYWRHDYTVTYRCKSGKSGSLYYGGPTIKIDEEIVFNVSHTGGA